MNQAEIDKRLEEFRKIGKASFFSYKPRGRATDDSGYSLRAQAALALINRPDYPAGMIPWLGEARPDLYRELTEILPEEIHYMWSQHKPLEEFEQVLKRLVETHRSACALYRTTEGPGRKTLN